MHQTDRKTEQTRQTAQEKESVRQKQSGEIRSTAALALQAILAGGSWDQLPAEGLLGLSHTIGNGALAELAALRGNGPETGAYAMPRGACTTAPTEIGFGEPATSETPAFGAMSPMGETAPMAV